MLAKSKEGEGVHGRRLFRLIAPAFPARNVYSSIARITTALGPVCVASAVGRIPGWDAEVIDENNYCCRELSDKDGHPDHEAIQEMRPADAVGFYGGLSSTAPRIYHLAKLYSKMGVATIGGGQHFMGENIGEGLAQGLDLIVLGEGEESIVECLPALMEKSDMSHIAGLAYLKDGKAHFTEERPPIENFETFPLPDFSLVRFAKMTMFPVSRVRGCGMDCEFCSVKGRPRHASAENALSQFMSAAERWNASSFFIVDDLFGQDRAQALRLCAMLKDYQERSGRSFFIIAQIRLDKSRDSELLAAMRGAGIRMVCIGYESPIPEELKAMNKRLTPDDMVDMTRVFRAAGFHVHGMFIFGYPLPGGAALKISAKERVGCFRDFIKKAELDTFQTLLPVPLPGTQMTARLEREGRIFPRESAGWECYDGNFPLFHPDPPLTPEVMLQSVRQINSFSYRLRQALILEHHALLFPSLVFWLYQLRSGWRRRRKGWQASAATLFGLGLGLLRWRSRKDRIFLDKLGQASGKKASKSSAGTFGRTP